MVKSINRVFTYVNNDR